MTIQELFTDEVKALVTEYNAYHKLGHFLHKNPECKQYVTKINDYRLFEIERELIPFVYILHGKRVRIRASGIGARNGEMIEGIIEHLPTRWYQDYPSKKQVETENSVAFRREYENEAYDAPETIAFWVNTGDKYSTHLYTANNIEIID